MRVSRYNLVCYQCRFISYYFPDALLTSSPCTLWLCQINNFEVEIEVDTIVRRVREHTPVSWNMCPTQERKSVFFLYKHGVIMSWRDNLQDYFIAQMKQPWEISVTVLCQLTDINDMTWTRQGRKNPWTPFIWKLPTWRQYSCYWFHYYHKIRLCLHHIPGKVVVPGDIFTNMDWLWPQHG